MSIANSGNIGGIRPSIGQGKGSLPKGDLGASFQDALRSVQDLKTNSSSVMAPAIEPLKFFKPCNISNATSRSAI